MILASRGSLLTKLAPWATGNSAGRKPRFIMPSAARHFAGHCSCGLRRLSVGEDTNDTVNAVALIGKSCLQDPTSHDHMPHEFFLSTIKSRGNGSLSTRTDTIGRRTLPQSRLKGLSCQCVVRMKHKSHERRPIIRQSSSWKSNTAVFQKHCYIHTYRAQLFNSASSSLNSSAV